MRRLVLSAAMLGVATLAGCVAPSSPPPAQPIPVRPPPLAPLPPPPPSPPLPVDWRDWPVSAGDWRYRVDTLGSTATFGPENGLAEFSLSCDAARAQIILSRRVVGVMPGAVSVRTTSLERSIAVQPSASMPGYVSATLPARDPLLDAMSFSRGRFVVQSEGAQVLVAPSWAEVPRVIEDCRR
jgi:hypothetical protein